jgi:very-short-patch-repair endonuclease
MATGERGWRQLIDYHLLATQRASVAEPVPIAERAAWAPLDLPAEHIITGRADVLAMDTATASLVDQVTHDETLYYGWPMVVMADRSRRLHVAPMLMTALETAPDSDTFSPTDDSPYLNPGLLTERFFPPEVLAAALACVPDDLPFGDPDGMGAVAVAVLEALGFDASHVDPDRLIRSASRPRAGVHNTPMIFRGPSDLSTRGLIEELGELRGRPDWQQTAAAWLVAPPQNAADPQAPPTGHDPRVSPFGLPLLGAEGLELNDSQEQAIEASRTQPLTVVTGPPGTGKSQLIAAAVINQWTAGRTVLVASTNNKALEVAVERCAGVDPALLLRTGNREARDELPAKIEALAARPAPFGASPDVIRRHLEVAAAHREELLEALTARTRCESELAQAVIDREQLRRLLWADPHPGPVHHRRARLHRAAGKLGQSRWLRNWRAQRLLTAAAPTVAGVRADDVARWAAVEAHADALTEQLERFGSPDPARERHDVQAADRAWAEASTSALRDIVAGRLNTGRAALQQLARLRSASRLARVEATVRTLPHTPGWACTALSAQANFPLTAGMFDLLILDEASQCSLAQVIPLAYRARRILVVGDPNQLTPIVTLATATLHDLAAAVDTSTAHAQRARVSVGKDSAFTAYAARSPAVPLLLNMHYRCHPAIARWFNDHFYEGALRVLTAVDAGDPRPRGLHLLDVPGRTQRSDTGDTSNEEEANAIASWILEHNSRPATVGVVAPFTAQATLIRRRLREELGEAAEAIAVGTAHTFQGGERDTILFSATLASDAHLPTARWVESERNLINVAASRAKRALIVVADKTALKSLPVPTLNALVHAAGNPIEPSDAAVHEALSEDAALHSQAERRLYEAFHRAGIRAEPKLIVEGYELDFAIRTPTGQINVEIDGIHHTDTRGRQRRQDLARDRVLEGLDWRVLRFPAWRCLADPDQVTADIQQFLETPDEDDR